MPVRALTSPATLIAVGVLALAVVTGPGVAAPPSAIDGRLQVRSSAEAGDRYATPVVPAHPSNRSNPLAGRAWGVYRGGIEQAWEPYERARGTRKRLLAEIALRPKSKWFVRNQSPRRLTASVREYVRVSQDGDPQALVQMALFGMAPWGDEMCRRAPNQRERASYQAWIRGAAAGIGGAHAAVVMQPDLLIARCGPRGGAAIADLVGWASRHLARLPHTAVYVDAGAWDWPHPGDGGASAAADYLVRAGVRSARGFALNGTHYSPLALEVRRARELSEELERRGIRGKRAVISTTSNGKGFEFGRYRPQRERDNARTCRSRSDQRTCVMLGVPPTADTDAARWGLSAESRREAARYVDGYVWFGRPWLHDQASPFVMRRALDLVRSWRLRPGR